MSSYLITFFTTMAQVSFTATGLLTVAIAVDVETRQYWLGNRSRRVFAFDHLFLILWPGFISLGGLIPPGFINAIPAWPYATVVIGLFYVIVLANSYAVYRKREDRHELQKLLKIFSNPVVIILIYSIVLFYLCLSGYLSYMRTPEKALMEESALAVILTALTAHAVLAAALMLRPLDNVSKQSSSSAAPIDQPSLPSSKTASQNSSLSTATFMLAAISLILGILLSHLIPRKSK